MQVKPPLTPSKGVPSAGLGRFGPFLGHLMPPCSRVGKSRLRALTCTLPALRCPSRGGHRQWVSPGHTRQGHALSHLPPIQLGQQGSDPPASSCSSSGTSGVSASNTSPAAPSPAGHRAGRILQPAETHPQATLVHGILCREQGQECGWGAGSPSYLLASRHPAALAVPAAAAQTWCWSPRPGTPASQDRAETQHWVATPIHQIPAPTCPPAPGEQRDPWGTWMQPLL